jgi:hypothetical protein
VFILIEVKNPPGCIPGWRERIPAAAPFAQIGWIGFGGFASSRKNSNSVDLLPGA